MAERLWNVNIDLGMLNQLYNNILHHSKLTVDACNVYFDHIYLDGVQVNAMTLYSILITLRKGYTNYG